MQLTTIATKTLALLLFCTGSYATSVQAQTKDSKTIREGDIIFQKLPCGGLCDAIIATTPCKPGMAFNHCGIIHFDNQVPYVIEAIGKAVKQTPLAEFEKRDTDKVVYVGRIKSKAAQVSPLSAVNAVVTALQYIGTPYDDAFLPGDKALYCSELVWECYHDKKGQPLFGLQPMTFKSPNTGTTYPAWTSYYKDIGQPIPEGVEGINPCAIANADIIDFMTLKK